MERPTRLTAAGAAGCSLLFLLLGAALVGEGGLGHDEGWHAEPAVSLVEPRAAKPLSYWPALPLMRDAYNGSLKTYVLYLPFKAFGAGVRTLRWTTLALGALALFFLVLLAARLYGTALGLLSGLFFATDPALLLAACYDTGPAVLMLLLKFSGLWFLAEGKPFAAGLLFGLGQWDKAHFLWFLCALPLCARLFFGDELRARLTKAGVRAGAAGFLLGASPFLLFNLRHPLATFIGPGSGGSDLFVHLGRLPAWLAPRAESLVSALLGFGQYGMVSGVHYPGTLLLPLAAGALLGLWLSVAAFDRAGWPALKGPAFWSCLTVLIFLAACLSPYDVKWHHLYTAYPFPQLALVALLYPARRRPWVLLFFGFCAASHLSALRSFRGDMARTGGSEQFYRGVAELDAWLEGYAREHPGAPIGLDEGFEGPLTVYSRGNLALVDLAGADAAVLDRHKLEHGLELLSSPEAVAVVRAPRRDGPPDGNAVFRALKALGARPEALAEFRRPDGEPWAAVYRPHWPVAEGFSRAAALLRRGKEAEARREIGRGMEAWRTLERELGARGVRGPGLWPVIEGSLKDATPEERLVFSGAAAELSDCADDSCLTQAAAAADAGRRDLALRLLGRAEGRRPDLARRRRLFSLYGRLGEEQKALRQRSLALPELARAAADRPPPERARELANFYQELGEHGRCAALLRRLVPGAPRDAGLRGDLGLCEYLDHDEAGGIRDLEEAVRLDPAGLPARMSLGYIDMERGRYRQALERYDRVLGAAPAERDADLRRRALASRAEARSKLGLAP